MKENQLWLASLSIDELLDVSPWRMLEFKYARGFFITSAIDAMARFNSHYFESLSTDEVLHETHPIIVDCLPQILKRCAETVEPNGRARFIFGCLRLQIRRRIPVQIFGSIPPSQMISLEAINSYPKSKCDSRSFYELNSSTPAYDTSNLEVHCEVEAQFLSENEYVADDRIQSIHRLVEMFRHHLTSREVQVLRSLLLNYTDRSLVALEVCSTPKLVSRHRISIQQKMKKVLKGLGWTDTELEKLVSKVGSS